MARRYCSETHVDARLTLARSTHNHSSNSDNSPLLHLPPPQIRGNVLIYSRYLHQEYVEGKAGSRHVHAAILYSSALFPLGSVARFLGGGRALRFASLLGVLRACIGSRIFGRQLRQNRSRITPLGVAALFCHLLPKHRLKLQRRFSLRFFPLGWHVTSTCLVDDG